MRKVAQQTRRLILSILKRRFPDGERGYARVGMAIERGHGTSASWVVEHGMDCALGRNADVAVQSADQELADLAGPPMGLVALGRDDQALDLPRQLVGVANRPARAIGQGLETVFLVALEDLVAGLARNAEPATDLAHRFAVQQPSDKPQALVHHRTLLPRHPRLPRKGEGVTHVSGTICHLCLGPLTP